MQNRSIGEARTKAFLIDRFWILERSVDIDGADFIVQAKPADHEILRTIVPKFGRVQSKFIQDNKTSIRLKKDYVVDPDGTARDDFFLIIHTGDETSQELFLLTSKDIIQKSYERNGDFVLNNGIELSMTRVLDRKRALDRMENSIKCVSFIKNRLYIFSNIEHVTAEFNSILPVYKEDIEYWFGTVSELFIEKKQKAFKYLKDIEEVHGLLKDFIVCVDPIEAALIAESIKIQYGREYQDVYDENLYFGGKRHLYEVTKLREDGALDNYINGRKSIEYSIDNYFNDKIDMVVTGTIHTIKVLYDADTLRIKNIENSHSYNQDAPSIEFINCNPGRITMSRRIGVFNGKVNDGSLFLMEKIIELKYY